jgi:hypothetical protein
MIPGGDQIVACPHCAGLAKYEKLLSGNSFGALVWTDGKQEAPMMYRPPPFVKCSHCAGYYWLADAQEVGRTGPMWYDDQPADPGWADAPTVDEPTEEEYYEVLRSGLTIDPEQVKGLRTMAWWRRNDAFRLNWAGNNAAMSGACRENLETLAGLMDETDQEGQLMKAEILRELGEFDAATLVLDRVVSPDFGWVVSQIRQLCDAGEVRVKPLVMPSM